MNVFDLIFGNPAPVGPRAEFQAALKALKAARARGDKPAERAELARMQAASRAMQKAAGTAVRNVAQVDNAVATVKSAAHSAAIVGSRVLMLAGAAAALWLWSGRR